MSGADQIKVCKNSENITITKRKLNWYQINYLEFSHLIIIIDFESSYSDEYVPVI